MASDARGVRLWAWPSVAAGVLIFLGTSPGDGPLDARAVSRVGGQAALGLLAIALGAAATHPRPIARTLMLGPTVPPVSARELAGWALGLLALSVGLDQALAAGGLRDGSRLADIESALADLGRGDLPFALLGIVLAPAIAEEILFRGLLLGALARRLGPLPAVALSSALFGAAHFDLAQGLAAAVLGLFLAAVTLASGSVRPAIAVHACNNAFALLASTWSAARLEQPVFVTGAVALLAAGLVASTASLARRLRARSSAPD